MQPDHKRAALPSLQSPRRKLSEDQMLLRLERVEQVTANEDVAAEMTIRLSGQAEPPNAPESSTITTGFPSGVRLFRSNHRFKAT